MLLISQENNAVLKASSDVSLHKLMILMKSGMRSFNVHVSQNGQSQGSAWSNSTDIQGRREESAKQTHLIL